MIECKWHKVDSGFHRVPVRDEYPHQGGNYGDTIPISQENQGN